jgi:hypothetical protein
LSGSCDKAEIAGERVVYESVIRETNIGPAVVLDAEETGL